EEGGEQAHDQPDGARLVRRCRRQSAATEAAGCAVPLRRTIALRGSGRGLPRGAAGRAATEVRRWRSRLTGLLAVDGRLLGRNAVRGLAHGRQPRMRGGTPPPNSGISTAPRV